MKYSLALLTAAFSMLSCTAYCQSKNPLIGTWHLVSSKGTSNGQEFSMDSSMSYQIKVITPTTMIFTNYNKATDSLRRTAQGRITVNGNQYIESITRASSKSMVGMSFSYTYNVTGNRWRIEGGGNGLQLKEEWIKVD